MALQFVPGHSGAGKSFQLYQKILQEAREHPERNYLVIVPEQFTMQTQKELVSLSPRHGIMNVDILSFDRLAHRVFAEVGGDQTPVLEDVGKILVLERVVQEQKKKLGVLGSSLEKLGTVSEMKSLLSELMQYDIHPEELDEIGNLAKEKPLLYHKLKDVQTIYQGFSEFLRKRYITAEEVLDLLCEKIGSSRLVRDSWIILDGFTGFTPVQNKLLRELLKLARQIWVTVTLDEKVSVAQLKRPQHLFRMSGEMMESLTRMAAEERVEILDPWWVHPGEHSRFCEAPALEFLEQHLFRYDKRQFRKEQEEVQIFQAGNPKEEMEEIARRIRLLVRTKGYRYGDFAVITGDMTTYGSYARQVMEQCKIPCFIDEKHSILMNPFVEYIRAAVNLVVEHFSYESMFRYLRCGLSGIPVYQVDQLENYCIAVGIRGEKQWNDHWVRRYRGMEEGSIEAINQIRERVWEKIGPFAAYMKEKEHTVEERTRMLYEMIVKDGIQERLAEKEQEFAAQGDQAMVKEYSQIYGMIMELLDKMVQMLGSETITAKEYGQLLDVGLQEMRVGIIPPTADQVLIGEMERTRLKDIKVLFFAGVNDGIIPKHGGRAGLLSESDVYPAFLSVPESDETFPVSLSFLCSIQRTGTGAESGVPDRDDPSNVPEIGDPGQSERRDQPDADGATGDGDPSGRTSKRRGTGAERWLERAVFLVSAFGRMARAVSSLDPGGIRGSAGEQHRKSGGSGTLRERTGQQCDGTGTVCSLCLCTFSAIRSEDRGTAGVRIPSGGSWKCDPSGVGAVFEKPQKEPADLAGSDRSGAGSADRCECGRDDPRLRQYDPGEQCEKSVYDPAGKTDPAADGLGTAAAAESGKIRAESV